jgi:hypothetical protein
MENSILTSVKAVLGLPAEYTAFDEDILMHINSVFADLHQVGIGPTTGFVIEDDSAGWDTYITAGPLANQLHSVRSLVFLRVRLLFDPPATSYLISSMERQIEKFEWRLNVAREEALHPVTEFI